VSVYESFTEGLAFPDLVEAQVLLEELDGASTRGVPVRPKASLRDPLP
jgi:hypothetical protein